MEEFQTKNKKSKILHSPLMLFCLLCLLLVFMYNMIGLVEKSHDTKKKKETVFNQNQTLLAREAYLEANIDKLKTKQGMEETLRDKYHLVKEGEKMVVIVDQEANALESTQKSKSSNGFIQFFKNLFK